MKTNGSGVCVCSPAPHGAQELGQPAERLGTRVLIFSSCLGTYLSPVLACWVFRGDPAALCALCVHLRAAGSGVQH